MRCISELQRINLQQMNVQMSTPCVATIFYGQLDFQISYEDFISSKSDKQSSQDWYGLTFGLVRF
jgi:hypothetical protein